MIDLNGVKSVLVEIHALVEELDQCDLSDVNSSQRQGSGVAERNDRRENARLSQKLQLLATRFELAAALTRTEFWYAKGEVDPLRRKRTD